MADVKGGGQVVMVKKPNMLRILVIVGICFLLGCFGFFYSYFGRFTGDIATDGTRFQSDPDPVAYTADTVKTVTLDDGVTQVDIPDVSSFDFTSDDMTQTLNIGNPSSNEGYYMKIILQISGQSVEESGMLKPGEGFGDLKLEAVFKPYDYPATLGFSFYKQADNSKKIEYVGYCSEDVTLHVTGGTEYYDQMKSESSGS